MKLPPAAEKALDLAEAQLPKLQAAALLLVRLFIGQAFFLTGSGKWSNFDRTVRFFESLGIPAPSANAAFVASLELVGGILIALGLGTRVIAALLSSTMVVALLTAEREGFIDALLGRGEGSLTDVTAFVYLIFLILLVAFGPGLLSPDHFIRRKLRPESKL